MQPTIFKGETKGGDMGEMTGGIKGGIKKLRCLYIKGFRRFDGRDGGLLKNVVFSLSEAFC